MINQLTIRNFKSVKELNVSCRKLNVFIGEPNSGKSNIIEALALRSQNAFGEKLNQEIFRYKTIADLFYDFNINNPIEIISENQRSILKYYILEDRTPANVFSFLLDSEKNKDKNIIISHEGVVSSAQFDIQKTDTRFYEYKRLSKFSPAYLPHLSVPHGDNLPALLLSNSDHKKWVSDFLKSAGLTLTLKPVELDIVASKLVNDEIYSYPYLSLSETFQRMIFYNLAIKSNNKSILLLDEPDSNTFPFYTKYLAERIALDETNQFFITTHNPYLLLSLIEKSNKNELNVFIVQMKDYQTTASVLDEKQLSEVLDFNSDVFFNFGKILGE